MLPQVPCTPAGKIVVRVTSIAPAAGAVGIELSLAFLSVSGPANAIAGVLVKSGWWNY